MNDDSHSPAPSEGPEANNGSEPIDDMRPHPLDATHEDWTGPSKSYLTIRNAFALAVTFFTSTILALGIGLPNSVGAMLGVFVATFVLFGPLWFALFNQNFADRFQFKQRESEEPDPEDGAIASLDQMGGSNARTTAATPAVVQATPADSEDAESAASRPAAEPLPSYYQPIQRRDAETISEISGAGYAIIVVFALFVGVLVIGSPFLAAAIVWAYG